jgi:peroxiredoxin
LELILPARLVFLVAGGLLFAGTAACLLALSARMTLLRQPRTLEGLRPGDAVPRFDMRTTSGRVFQVPTAARATLLVFADSNCQSCVDLLPELDTFADGAGSMMQVLVVTPGTPQHAAHFAEETGLRVPIIGDEGLIASTYKVNVSPVAALVGTDGRIAAMTRPAAHAVPDLLARLSRAEPR